MSTQTLWRRYLWLSVIVEFQLPAYKSSDRFPGHPFATLLEPTYQPAYPFQPVKIYQPSCQTTRGKRSIYVYFQLPLGCSSKLSKLSTVQLTCGSNRPIYLKSLQHFLAAWFSYHLLKVNICLYQFHVLVSARYILQPIVQGINIGEL